MNISEIRKHLNDATNYHRRAKAAESVRLHIRLHGKMAVEETPKGARLGRLLWRNKGEQGAVQDGYQFQELTGEQTSAVYDALAIVMTENNRRAREKEELVEKAANHA